MSRRLPTASALALGLAVFAPLAHAQDAATVQQAVVVRDAAMRANIALDYVTQLTTRFGARPAGSKSEPPLPPPIGMPVSEFLKICSKPRNLTMPRYTEGWNRNPPLYARVRS